MREYQSKNSIQACWNLKHSLRLGEMPAFTIGKGRRPENCGDVLRVT